MALTGDAGRRRVGRRPGHPDTRGEIVAAAWQLFRTEGYAGTSMRAVAAASGCDPKLVRHYFGTKQQLFVEAMAVGVDTGKMVGYVLGEGLEGAGVRFVTALTAIYESAAGRHLAASFRTDPALHRTFWSMISARLVEVAEPLLPSGRGRRERTLAQVQALVAGLLLARYVDPAPPASTLSRDEAITTYGALLQHILTRGNPVGEVGSGLAR